MPEPSDLDVGLLALFAGFAAQDLALAAMAEAGFGDLRPAHGFIVQHLLDGPRTATELAALQQVSVQAISKTTAELVSLGYLTSEPDPVDGRQRRLALSERGRASVVASRTARRRVQQKLVRKLGADRVNHLTAELADVLEALGGADAVRRRTVRQPI